MMKKIFAFAILITALIACKNKSVNQNSAQTDEFKAFTEKVKQINMNVRTPDDLKNMLELTAVDFMPELINDPNINEKYLSNEVLASANIGVYLVDGLYQYSSKDLNGYKSIMAAKNLATKLDMGAGFENLVLDRYNNANPEIDTLLAKLDESIVASETDLKEKDKLRLFTGLIGGNYIEKQYILFNIIFKYNIDLPEETKLLILREVLFATNEHMKKLPELISLIESVKKDTDPGTILNELKAIETLRQQLVFPGDPSKLTPKMIFENKILLAMFDKIKTVRGMIVAVPASEK
jgi:hypothetical protein